MTLTGKCKEDFESYLEELDRRDIEGVYCDYNGTFYCYNDYHFSCLPESMQYGVYVDFFDSVGVRVIISVYWEDKEYFQVDTHNFSEYDINARPEARTAAIEKANEIYNER
jgi:hypothetical protein